MDNFQDEISKAQELRKANILNSFSNADDLTKAIVAGQTKMINGKLHVWKQLPSGKFDWRKAPATTGTTHQTPDTSTNVTEHFKDDKKEDKKDVDVTPKKVDAEVEDKEEVKEDDTKLPHIVSYLRGKKQGTTIEITRDAKNKIYNEAGNESSYLNSGDTIKKLPGGIYLMYSGDTRDKFGPIDPHDKTLNALTNDDFKEVDPNAKKLTPVGNMKQGSHYMLEGKEHEYVRYDRGKKHPYILRDVKTNQLTAAGPRWMASKYPNGIEEVTKTASKNTYAEHIEKFAEHIKGAAKSHSYLHISYNEKADVVYVMSKNGNVITRANNQNKKYGFDKTQLKDLGDKLRDMGYSIAIHK